MNRPKPAKFKMSNSPERLRATKRFRVNNSVGQRAALGLPAASLRLRCSRPGQETVKKTSP